MSKTPKIIPFAKYSEFEFSADGGTGVRFSDASGVLTKCEIQSVASFIQKAKKVPQLLVAFHKCPYDGYWYAKIKGKPVELVGETFGDLANQIARETGHRFLAPAIKVGTSTKGDLPLRRSSLGLNN